MTTTVDYGNSLISLKEILYPLDHYDPRVYPGLLNLRISPVDDLLAIQARLVRISAYYLYLSITDLYKISQSSI